MNQPLTIIIAAAVVAGAVLMGGRTGAQTENAPAVYEIRVAQGTYGIFAWRLNTVTGDMLFCSSLGGNPPAPQNAGCRKVPTPN